MVGANKEHPDRFQRLEPESQGQILALTVLFVARTAHQYVAHIRQSTPDSSLGFQVLASTCPLARRIRPLAGRLLRSLEKRSPFEPQGVADSHQK